MGFGIIRARNLSAGDIAGTDKHNARQYSSEKEYPENIQIGGEYEAKYKSELHENYIFKDDDTAMTLQKAIDIRLKVNDVKGIRKNSNLAIEYVCTINDKRAWDKYNFSAYVSQTKKWLERRHGKDSLVASYSHLDESNPHVHFVFVPLETKEIKWKNKNGEGVRTETRLNTRAHTGGREKLAELQDDYYSHLVGTYGAGENNKLGVPLYRGIKANEEFDKYTQSTDYKIGALRNELLNCHDDVERKEKELLIAREQANFKQKEIEHKQKIGSHSEKARTNWDKKGTRDNPTIFHTEKELSKKQKNKGKSSGMSK